MTDTIHSAAPFDRARQRARKAMSAAIGGDRRGSDASPPEALSSPLPALLLSKTDDGSVTGSNSSGG